MFETNRMHRSQRMLKTSALHFDLSSDVAYKVWRQQKLAAYPMQTAELIVSIHNISNPSKQECAQLRQLMSRYNMVIYDTHCKDTINAEQLLDFTQKFGLVRIDDNLCAGEQSVSTLRVVEKGRNKAYIPYTNKPISWHTDGYYNSFAHTIRSFVLHCNFPAQHGGDNHLLDPEILYILLRDKNPEYIEALMAADVMTIPANIENNIEIRRAQSGPVFSVDPNTGCLHMRYTARSRSIEWKSHSLLQQAISTIRDILTNDSRYIIQHILQTGQGLVCNNVLHNRTAFEDGADIGNTREFLRARFYDRVPGQE